MRSGFYAGSFDPPTLGHLDIITRSFTLVDKLVIGIGTHATKQSFFSIEQRVAMLKEIATPLAKRRRAKLEVVSFSGLLVSAARKHKANIIIRGLRNAADFDYEAQMTAMNHKMASNVETIFLSAAPEVDFISSTLVRQIANMGGDVKKFVPPQVLKHIKKMKGKK